MSIEDLVLSRDQRGISALRGHLPSDFCHQAAALVPEEPGTAIIITGFYILAAQSNETDGPPGAVATGMALESLGYEAVYVTDRYTAPVMTGVIGSRAEVVDFPITDDEASKRFAGELLAKHSPSVAIAIERCGLTAEGHYRNMHGDDIGEYNARTDHLFTGHPATVGIGDGGNELGMGNLASVIADTPSLVKIPCVTKVTKLIIASVSNWGGYGLVASLSKLKGQNLLPSVEAEQELLKRTVSMGAVDGMSRKAENKVDGFTMEENSEAIEQLHAYLAGQGI